MFASASIPRLLAALVLLACSTVARGEDLLGVAERQLAEGRADAAYVLLQPLAAASAGDTRFDYVFALAALGSGRPAEAIDPLRRVLAAEPRFDAARLELARALGAAGSAESARAEYRLLSEQGASALTREIADRELAGSAAEAPPTASAPALRTAEIAWSAGGGYDSNANAATSESAFFGFQLDPREQRQASPFVEAGADFRARRPLGSLPARLSATLRAGHRVNVDAHDFDQTVVDGGGAIEGRAGTLQWGAALHATGGLLDGREHFVAPYAEVSASIPVREGAELVGLARAIALDYRQPDFEPLDVRRYVWGGALQTQARAGGLPRLGLALLGGRDVTRDRSSPFSNDRWGARLFAARELRRGATVYGEVSWLTSDFFGARGFQRVDRLDRQWVGLVGVELRSRGAQGWSVGPQVRLTRNESNVGVFRYDRVEVSVFFRRTLR
jgi:thioredoxin-like negative regulator of GroEL